MTPKSAAGAAHELRIAVGRLRSDPSTWPWSARLDRHFGTKPLFETIATGPTYGVRDWVWAIQTLIKTTFFTARGRAWLRWHWDYMHNGGARPELRRRFNALDRLKRQKSRYWEQSWFLEDDEDADHS